MKQLMPQYDEVGQYAKIQRDFIDSLSQKMDLTRLGNHFSPFPLMVDRQISEQIKTTHQVLVKAIESLVTHYLDDERIQAILPLSDTHKQWIQWESHRPYRLFSIRPDFLISQTNTIKICEINARFTLNGFVSAYYLHQQLAEDYGETLELEHELEQIITGYLSRFDLMKPIMLLRDQEVGYDLNLLKDRLLDHGVDVIDITPNDLALTAEGVSAKGVVCEQIILELHQSELSAIDDRIMQHLISSVNYVNDLRTIMIAHDKRLLVLLSNPHIMSRYLTEQEVRCLTRHIIPTHLVNTVADDIITHKDRWVLKKCQSGKGEGMYVGLDCDLNAIQQVVSELSPVYIAQPYLKQKQIDLFFNGRTQTCRGVGMILSLNGAYHGTGYFRFSTEHIIALSRGGCAVAACFK
ncbi:hypothetical protein ACFFUP_12245 [Vibrio ostreicida]|uniref:Glutathionylspermidine synthase pre-ATP-grasp-like domain-containing protein n=1 Tax=Vibrio ostreicida TaxID=526588 RepID=A0ABT8C1X2_9VIBR|nr:hypothetical protein [Vibrio ostreicida]MDN3611276.1 hypothetical protein [Vibrio ostreicida]MDN3612606.1 hypothetical protein [Vibrio ostreicida]NPD09221.1 hypothetical protein [Vibrio ostreicida]